jgi:hypothetical protein
MWNILHNLLYIFYCSILKLFGMSVLGLMLGAQMHPTLLFYSHCLKPDDFTCQGESAATQWVNPLSGNAPRCTLLYSFTLSNARRFYLSGGECCHSMG